METGSIRLLPSEIEDAMATDQHQFGMTGKLLGKQLMIRLSDEHLHQLIGIIPCDHPLPILFITCYLDVQLGLMAKLPMCCYICPLFSAIISHRC